MNIKKQLNVEVKAVNNRVISFLASPATIDRDNEFITPSGWVLDNYKKNPVFLWGHDRYEPPIGKAVNVYVDDTGLNIDVEFADAKTYDFADTIFKLYKGGYLNAVSVGFAVIERDVSNPNIITKQELYELSGVTVPANQDALAKALNDKVIDEKCYNGICDISDNDIKQELKNLKSKLNENEKLIKDLLAKADAGDKPEVSKVNATIKELISDIKTKINEV